MSWETICTISDLPPNTGVAALVNGVQIAIFRAGDEVYALNNYCPFAKANVISRGIIGDLGGELCVASPIYKQHYTLNTGQCLEDETVKLPRYEVRLTGDKVELSTNAVQAA